MKRIFYILGINLTILVALMLVIEVGARVIIQEKDLVPMFSDENLRTRQRPFVHRHQTRGFSLKPGFSNGMYSVNKDGFRGPELPRNLMQKRVIITLGESTTFGWNVGDKDTYPAYLHTCFQPGDNVYVINGGVPSYTSSQVLVTLKEVLESDRFNLSLILIGILWNDIWYSTVTNWHPEILVYQKPPNWLNFITQYSRFAYGCTMGFSKQEEPINVFNDQALAQYIENIEKMIQACKAKEIPIAFVAPPFDAEHIPESGLNEFHVRYTKSYLIQTAQVYYKNLTEVADKHMVPVIEHGLDLRYLNQKSLFLDALHPTSDGNQIMARDIYKRIRKEHLLDKEHLGGMRK